MTTDEIACPRWQRRPAERRAEILAAAKIVFGEEGYARATLAQVARRAAVSAATVSHYFGSKAALFEAMLLEESVELDDDPIVLVPGPAGYRGLLHELLAEKWRRTMAPGNPEVILTVFREMADFPAPAQHVVRRLSERFRARLVAVLEAGTAAGEFTVANPTLAARLIGNLMLGAMLDVRFVCECTGETPCTGSAFDTILVAVDCLIGPAAA
jgi:AcrR family transcriptional regulator